MIHHRLWGENRIFVLGIVLKEEDIERECLSKGQSVGKLSESIYFMEDVLRKIQKLPAVEMAYIFTEDIKISAVEMA